MSEDDGETLAEWWWSHYPDTYTDENVREAWVLMLMMLAHMRGWL